MRKDNIAFGISLVLMIIVPILLINFTSLMLIPCMMIGTSILTTTVNTIQLKNKLKYKSFSDDSNYNKSSIVIQLIVLVAVLGMSVVFIEIGTAYIQYSIIIWYLVALITIETVIEYRAYYKTKKRKLKLKREQKPERRYNKHGNSKILR